MNGSRLIATAILANSTIHYFKIFNLFFNHFEHNYLKIIPTELFINYRSSYDYAIIKTFVTKNPPKMLKYSI